ncbi:MAG: ABC transporter permease [Candidatus Asgardarchaeia archaeon]
MEMNLKRVFTRIIMKEMKRKTTIVVFILLSISSYHVLAFFSSQVVYSFVNDYHEERMWPAEIEILPSETLTNYSYLDYVAEHVNEIGGVKWSVYPGGGILVSNMFSYNDESYYLFIMWCNVDDLTFPNQKYLIEGRLFDSNNESSIIVENMAKRLLEKLNMYHGMGKNKTTLQILDFNLTLVGVIADPRTVNVEDYYLQLGNTFYAWVPLDTYMALVQKTYNLTSGIASASSTIYVKVKEGFDVEDVAKRIRMRFTQIEVKTYKDYKSFILMQYLQMFFMFGLVPLVLFGLTIFWDINHNAYKIALLKALGWKRRDVAKYLLLKYGFSGALAGAIGMILSIIPIPFILFANTYVLILFLGYFPIQIIMMSILTVIFALPAVYKAYNMSTEVLRSW